MKKLFLAFSLALFTFAHALPAQEHPAGANQQEGKKHGKKKSHKSKKSPAANKS
jgi:hypothetical protein